MRSLQQDWNAFDLNVYKCGSHWHVGHSRERFEKRMKQALRYRNRLP